MVNSLKTKKSFKIQDHIGIFDNYFSDELCDKYLNYFKNLNVAVRNTHQVQDKHYSLLNNLYGDEINISYIGNDFQQVFWKECYPLYVEKYPFIKRLATHKIYDIKIQKTEQGEGYHVWHSESMSAATRNRFMVFSLYLNTVPGGETEFLYQGIRVEPVKGRMVLFPSTYTHVHRGNPPLKEAKYMLTGWVEFGA